MAKKRKRRGFLLSFFVVILSIAMLFVGGYFLLDKVVVPKFFSEYGIHSMGEMVGMMRTLYSSPNENKLVTNKFTEIDAKNAEDKLKNVFPTLENSEDLDYNAISEGKLKEGVEHPLVLEFSDKELAGIIDEMLEIGMLSKKLPDLEYIDTMKINILELTITPDNEECVDIHAIFKINTSEIREQMALEMGVSSFVIDMIIPNVMYITLDYTLEKTETAWLYNKGDISVNGRTAEQSEILLNLLIDFIFPETDKMDLDKLTHEFGNILKTGLEMLGEAQYVKNGIIINIG